MLTQGSMPFQTLFSWTSSCGLKYTQVFIPSEFTLRAVYKTAQLAHSAHSIISPFWLTLELHSCQLPHKEFRENVLTVINHINATGLKSLYSHPNLFIPIVWDAMCLPPETIFFFKVKKSYFSCLDCWLRLLAKIKWHLTLSWMLCKRLWETTKTLFWHYWD